MELSKKPAIDIKPMIFSAFFCFKCSFVYSLLGLLTVLKNWGSHSILLDGCLVTLILLAMINSLLSITVIVYKIILLVRNFEQISTPSGAIKNRVFYSRMVMLPHDWILIELAVASLWSLLVLGTLTEHLISTIYFFTGIIGLIVAIVYPISNKSLLMIAQVFAYFSVFAALADQVSTYYSKPSSATAVNTILAILFLLFHLRVIALFQILLSRQEEFKCYYSAQKTAAVSFPTSIGNNEEASLEISVVYSSS